MLNLKQIIQDLFSSRCMYWRNCKGYSHENVTCEKDNGNYSGQFPEFRPGGCYLSLAELKEKSPYYKS